MKHKKFTMIVALVLVVALAAGLGIWATGEEKLPTVTYYDGNDGNNARFAFTNTGKGSATDLFAQTHEYLIFHTQASWFRMHQPQNPRISLQKDFLPAHTSSAPHKRGKASYR